MFQHTPFFLPKVRHFGALLVKVASVLLFLLVDGRPGDQLLGLDWGLLGSLHAAPLQSCDETREAWETVLTLLASSEWFDKQVNLFKLSISKLLECINLFINSLCVTLVFFFFLRTYVYAIYKRQ